MSRPLASIGHLGPHLVLAAVLAGGRDAHDPPAGTMYAWSAEDAGGLGLFADLDAFLAGVFQQHLVELAADDLPGDGRFMLQVLVEIERRGDPAVLAGELHGILPREVRLLELLDHADPLEREVAERQQRLANVIAGEFLFFQEQHFVPVHGQDGRRGRAGRPAAHNDVYVIIGPKFEIETIRLTKSNAKGTYGT